MTVQVLFVASDEDRCAEQAARIEEAADYEMRVAGATAVAAVHNALQEADIDCVVFGEDEDPLSSVGVGLLDVANLCLAPPGGGQAGTIPLVLFSDGTYPMSTAKATDGVVDYVRSDVAGAHEQLAARIQWLTREDGDEDAGWFKQIVEQSADGVLTFDETGRIRYANGVVADLFGVDADDLEDELPSALVDRGLVTGEDAERLIAAVRAVVQGDADERTVELPVDPLFGTDREVLSIRLRELPGGAAGAAATLRPVTDYVHSREALEAADRKVGELSTAVADLRAAETGEQLFEVAARAVADVLGVGVAGVDAVDGATFVPLATVGADYGQSSAATGADATAFQTAEPVLEREPGTDDAPVDTGSTVVVPVEDVGVVRALGENLSERDRDLAAALGGVLAEAAARIRRQRAGERAHDQLASLEELLPSPVVSYVFRGGEPIIVSVNPAFEETFGVDADVAESAPLREYVAPPAEESAVAGDFGTDVDDVDAALRVDRQTEVPVRRETTDGVREFLLHTGPSNADGQDGVAVYVDVTDRRRAESARERQSELLDRIHEVATDDLRDRLNEARGYLELAVETEDPEDMAAVKQAHERIGRLIEDLNSLARRDADVEPEVVRLESVATRAWAGVETGDANFSVDDVAIRADPDRLNGLLGQLFRNAVDQAEVDPISAELDAEGDMAIRVGPLENRSGFFVEDTESEVPPRLQGWNLETGSADAVEEAEPRLAAVQGVAEAHGWSMRIVESDEGDTRFEFLTDP